MSDFRNTIDRIKVVLASYLGRRGDRRPAKAARDGVPKPAVPEQPPKVSVIIPIYGTEAYVEKCVRSVMNQTLREIEILCIDDASPDNSAAIVEQLAAEDVRVRLIRHEHNLGVGGARNTGIEAARAPYLASVDSDDYIEPNMLERLWDATQNGVADVVACAFFLTPESGEPSRTIAPKPIGWHRNDANQIDIFSALNPAFWNKLWRRSLFIDNDIRFPGHLYYEDLATTPRALHFADHIHIIPEPLYHYVTRAVSATNGASPKHILDYFEIFEILREFLEQQGLSDRYSEVFVTQVGDHLHYHTLSVLKADISQDEKNRYLRQILMLKLGYLEYNKRLRGLDARKLQTLLREATSRQDMDALLSMSGPEKAQSGGKSVT